ncbi:MAG: hypothetical protein JRH20_17195 [Deltaproteobacteria bacterium]|nr:hypothetical protein [Deltaproteobacteria bacterium]
MHAPLPGRVVYIDFEATGLDPQTMEPIEVAAIEVIDGNIGQMFTSLIHISQPLARTIVELTGINDAMLADAPPPAMVAPLLREFLGESPRLAHNAAYDELLLKRLLGRLPPAPVLDTLELGLILRPDLPTHALAALCERYDVVIEGAHRAEADVRALIGVVHALLTEAQRRPRQLRAILAPLAGGRWPWETALRTVLKQAHDEAEPELPPPLMERETDFTLGEAEIEAFFTKGEQHGALPKGVRPLYEALPRFEPRPQQQDMARLVASALSEGQHTMIEAPTGVGKSLAYLYPAARYALETGRRVMVSTNSKGLQDQLHGHDLPLLRAALGDHLRWQVVKGRGNYVCRERWRDLVNALTPAASQDDRVALAYLGAIVDGPGNGELEQVRAFMRERYRVLGYLVEQVRGHDCGGKGRHQECPTGRVSRLAARAHIVIINHSLLMTHSQLLPEATQVIIDEAHSLEERAAGVFANELLGFDLFRVWRRAGTNLGEQGLSRSLHRLVGRSKGKPGEPSSERAAQELARQAALLESTTARFGVAAQRIAQERKKDTQEIEGRELALADLSTAQRQKLEARLDALHEAILGMRSAVDGAIAYLKEEQGGRAASRRVLDRGLHDLKFALFEQEETLETFREAPSRREVRVLRVHTTRAERFSLVADPLHVGGELRERVFSRYRAVILTSASLSLADSGQFVARRIGFSGEANDENAPQLTQLAAPWDPKEAAINLLVEDLPPISESAQRTLAMAALIHEVVTTLGGRTLVLFSSTARMTHTARALRSKLEGTDLELLEQRRDGPIHRLLRQMRADSGTVLFGVQSFWSGVDIPGKALSCVIIERVPFASQQRPIIAARMGAEGEGYAGFDRYLLPRALLDLKQGAGRLLRGGSDRGVVVLCHENLSQKAYKDQAVAMLPGGETETVPHGEIGPALVNACEALGIPRA